MQTLIILLFLLLSMTSTCHADYEIRLNDGVTLIWHQYTIEGSEYCTHKESGKFCIQKGDVVAVREIKDEAGSTPRANVSTNLKYIIMLKNVKETPASRVSNAADANKEVFRVNVVSTIPGKIYLDGFYTGKSTPAVVNLPTPGLHIIGIGGDNNRYQEVHINAASKQTEIYFKDSGWLPSRTWKILLLSLRNMYLEGNKPAHLTDNDISEAYDSVLKTSREWIKDYSYGLAEWEVEKMTVENVYGHLQYDSRTGKYGDQIDDGRLINEANLMWLLDRYDSIFVFWPSIPDDSDQDPKGGCRGLCCFKGTSLVVPNACGRAGKWTERQGNSQIWIHEWLHTVEGYYGSRGYYVGNNGVHGAEVHGYSYDDQKGWLPWYKDLMRGQVIEGEKFVGIPPSAWISSTRRNLTAK